VRDMPRAQQLIEDGADLFGHSSMVAAVAAQARQDEWAAMDALSFGITGRARILTPAPAMGRNGGAGRRAGDARPADHAPRFNAEPCVGFRT
jgi:hypothetical protein